MKVGCSPSLSFASKVPALIVTSPTPFVINQSLPDATARNHDQRPLSANAGEQSAGMASPRVNHRHSLQVSGFTGAMASVACRLKPELLDLSSSFKALSELSCCRTIC